MDYQRRKELRAIYKQMKPEMGIFVIRANFSRKCFLAGTQDLKSTINGTKFKLNSGNHPNKQLQKDWQAHGKENFTIEILEKLKYDKDEAKTDYSEELAILIMLWEEKLMQQGLEIY